MARLAEEKNETQTSQIQFFGLFTTELLIDMPIPE